MTEVDDEAAGQEPQAARWSLRLGAWEVATLVALVVLAAVGGWWWGERAGGPRFNQADVGFLRDMTTHHDQAVEMAIIVLDQPSAGAEVSSFAREVLIFQRQEIGYMAALLDSWGEVGPDAEATAMAWMGMPVAARQMPGMASEDEMERLTSLQGDELDLFFLELMAEHHGGGVGMADSAAELAENREARQLAERIARYQRLEIGELAATAYRLAGDAARERVLDAGKRAEEAHGARTTGGH